MTIHFTVTTKVKGMNTWRTGS